MDIIIITNGFYGNRVLTEIDAKNVDRFILGYVDSRVRIPSDEKIDRTIIHIPNTKNSVFVYNKYKEERAVSKNRVRGNLIEPTLIIGDTVLYSRVIACGIDDSGHLTSINKDDCEEVFKYLSN